MKVKYIKQRSEVVIIVDVIKKITVIIGRVLLSVTFILATAAVIYFLLKHQRLDWGALLFVLVSYKALKMLKNKVQSEEDE